MKKHLHHLIIIIPLILIVGLVLFAFLRINGFIKPISVGNEVTEEDMASYVDNYDMIMPLMDENGYVKKQEVKKVLILGNDPFAEDRDAIDGMASMLSENTGAEVINCALKGTYATQSEVGNPLADPMDVYTPYFLSTLLAFPDSVNSYIEEGMSILGDRNPENAKEVIETLKNVDMSEIDIIVFMYDLTDYHMGKPTNIEDISTAEDTFSGGMFRAVNMINVIFPQVRVIVMSPYYNSFTDEDGNFASAELFRNTYGNPSEYVLSEGGVIQSYTQASFIDNYFGSITENNYSTYLRDDRHLNVLGRELLIKRLVDAIYYFDRQGDAS